MSRYTYNIRYYYMHHRIYSNKNSFTVSSNYLFATGGKKTPTCEVLLKSLATTSYKTFGYLKTVVKCLLLSLLTAGRGWVSATKLEIKWFPLNLRCWLSYDSFLDEVTDVVFIQVMYQFPDIENFPAVYYIQGDKINSTNHCQYQVANVEYAHNCCKTKFVEHFQSIKGFLLIQQLFNRCMIVNWQTVSMKPRTLLIYSS